MAEPTLSNYQQSTWTDTSATEATASVSWSAGDLVVVVGATEDNTVTLGVPSVTGLTFSQLVASNTASNCKAYIWTATAAGSGSGAINSSTTVAAHGLSAFVYTGSDGVGTPAALVGSTAKTISLTRTQANSHVIVVFGDWAEAGDVVVDATPTGTVRVAADVSTRACFYVCSFGDQGATGTTSYGITNHTGTVKMTGYALEVKGTAGGGGGTKAIPVFRRPTRFFARRF